MSNDIFDLFNATEAEGVEAQERTTGDFHNETTAPGGEGFPAQLTGAKVIDNKSDSKPEGSVEYRLTFTDISDGEGQGKLLTTRTYISRKQKESIPAYNKAKFLELAQLGLTPDFLRAKPSLEAQAKHLKSKAAEVTIVPSWEDSDADIRANRRAAEAAEAAGVPFPSPAAEELGIKHTPVRRFLSLDTYWEAASSKSAGGLTPKI